MRSAEQEIWWTGTETGTVERLRVGFENGGWTAEGTVSGLDITYVMRFDAMWGLRQFILFRDADEPDLWLATDGQGRWGETNGATRDDLDGCVTIGLTCSPFPTAAAIQRALGYETTEASYSVAMIDVEKLHIQVDRHRLRQVDATTWSLFSAAEDRDRQVRLDDFGWVIDDVGRFHRSGDTTSG